jgi:hypothetical protein
METHFLLAIGEGEFLAPLAMTGSGAFFNKLLEGPGKRRSFSSGVNSHCAATIASSSLGSSIVWW